MSERESNRKVRSDFPHLVPMPTRWADNDPYGHVNNATYYAYFDTVVNNYLIDQGGLDLADSTAIGVVVETMCRFFQSVSYPENLEIGMAVGKLGGSSVRYELAVFRQGEDRAVAAGHFVHVFIDRASGKPVAIPEPMRGALERLLIEADVPD